MSEIIPFRYGGFWDVPRYIALRYGGKVLYLQSPFDDELDDYPDAYSVYVVPDDLGESLLSGDWNPLDQSRLSFVGQIPINTVAFDPTKRQTLDAACLKSLFQTFGDESPPNLP